MRQSKSLEEVAEMGDENSMFGMTWCNESKYERGIQVIPSNNSSKEVHVVDTKFGESRVLTCPSCGHNIEVQNQIYIHDLPSLPAGVKFDPSDQEILEHLETKVSAIKIPHFNKLHPLIDEFIPTIEGENGICYTHPEKLPGISKDGQIRHFFHRPSKAYTSGTRKRRKVHTNNDGGETRWHKTGKTRPVLMNRLIKGYKKILVLYTNYGRRRKPEKTSWVMHQYHLGEEEKEGELVVSKVFYQTQPRLSGSSGAKSLNIGDHQNMSKSIAYVDQYYDSSLIIGGQSTGESPLRLIPNLVCQDDGSPL